MKNKVGVIMLGGVEQQKCFWPSYYNCDAGYEHDLIVVHRNRLGLPNEMENKYGKIFVENKIDSNGNDIPHRAFGAYRHYFNKFKDNYDIFIFISDDVIIKRDNWLMDIVNTLNIHKKLGFGASQIFNHGKRYPHKSHIRAPFWFVKTEVLKQINWEFEHDHDGEMKIGDQLTNAGYFGVQVGNKIDLGFDATEPNHITQLIEKKYYNDKSPFGKYYDIGLLEKLYPTNKMDIIISPYKHIGEQYTFIDIEPFNGLIYLPSLEIAKKYIKINNIGYNINLITNEFG